MPENIAEHIIPKSFHQLPLWKGTPILDTYGNKPVLDYRGEPLYAELFALRMFWAQGFKGVWADCYRKRYRTELPEKQEEKILLPDFVEEKLASINPNGKMSGIWDLVLWKDGTLKFVELKRKAKDRLRQSQIDFLQRALACGFTTDHFELFEWVEL